MKYDSIIFDLDGTLWEALKISSISWTNAFESLNISKKVTENDLKKVTGMPFLECLENLFPGIKNKYPDITDRIDHYEKLLIDKTGGNIYNGVIDGIKKIAGSYKVFIVSNCEDWYLESFFKHSGLKKFFTSYDCFGSSRISKSEMIKKLINNFNLKNAVYIGDTISDSQAALNANIDFIHAAYGFGKFLTDCKKINSFSEIIKILF